MPCEKKV